MERTIIIKGKAGLGNRILSTLCGSIFGLLTHRRIVVDWRDGCYANSGEDSFSTLFDSKILNTNPPPADSRSVAPKIWRDHLDWSTSKMIGTFSPKRFRDPTVYRTYCCDLSRIDHPEDVIVYWSYLPKFHRIAKHMRGEWSQYRKIPRRKFIKLMMERLMPLQPTLAAEIDDFVSANFQSPMIGVHIRLSDKKTPLDRTWRDVERFAQLVPNATIFLATDNTRVQETARCKNSRIIWTKKWLPDPGKPIHYNDNDTDRSRSAIEALKDIYLLSRCDYLVYPRSSTFSYLSSCLGEFEDQQLRDVERFSPIAYAKRAVSACM